jgi:hypothetical protein
MSKAIDSTTTIPTRRALLAGAPAAAAGALAAGTAVNAAVLGMARAATGATGTDGDSELLSLKPEFDDVFSDWVRQFTKDCVDHQEFERLHLARLGFGRDDAPEVDWKDPEYIAYDRELRCLIHEHHSGWSEDELELGHWDRLNRRVNPLAEKILSYKASTLDGVRLQTRALMIYDNEIWNATSWDDAEPGGSLCDFFASLCGVLGIPFPPVPERWQS